MADPFILRRKRRGKELDVVSTAIPGGAAAWNATVEQQQSLGENFPKTRNIS